MAVDTSGRVHILARGPAQVLVFDRDGAYLRRWGSETLSARPHGLTPVADGSLWCVDELDHVVRRFDPFGRLLQSIGSPGQPSDTGYEASLVPLFDRIATITRPGLPFHRPTALAIGPDGALFVADGYGNCRIHRFDRRGVHEISWGEPGTGPGQFHLPHDLLCLDDDSLLVADRENERLQRFSADGVWLEDWTDVQRPCALARHPDGSVFVGELAWTPGERSWTAGPIRQPARARITILDAAGRVLERIDGGSGGGPGGFVAPHGMTIDDRGRLFLGEVSLTYAKLNNLRIPDRNRLHVLDAL